MTNRRTAIITGGAGALGVAVAHRLHREQFRLALVDTHPERGARIVRDLLDAGADARFVRMDVCDQMAWERLRDELQSQWSQLDVLVNAAGITAIGEFTNVSFNAQQRVIDVNLGGAMCASHVMLPWLKQHAERSHLINVSSCAAYLSIPWSAAYNASKAGLLAFSETLAAEHPQSRLHICTVLPGFFPSELVPGAEVADAALSRVVDQLVARSRLTPEVVADRIWRAMRRRESYVVVPRRIYWLWWHKRIFPKGNVARLAKLGQKMRARWGLPPSHDSHDR